MSTTTEKTVKSIVYHAAKRKTGGVYYLLDEQGKKVPKLDPQTGAQMRMDGRLQFETRSFIFQPDPKHKLENPHCFFVLSETNPDYTALKITLDNMVKSGEIMTEAGWRKSINPQEFEARKELEAAQTKVTTLEQQNADLLARIAEIEGSATAKRGPGRPPKGE